MHASTHVDMLLPLLWLLWCAEEALLAARDGLVGQIQQLPPMYSAIKVGIMPG